ncbi:ASCH domain protein [Rhodobacteraceae bacterium THAF1]|uniref:ASCH domain-containing protein n=1 Tax=Palleronia sp. THAF1 TaxID=2587842 RepID=UPI000F4177E1|nr:ASCH domain-containing protein [Palleronia sp. THAF1]QFU08334.1 ASCH domain protein [Palleronia sp. THAF1]VDC28989.1 ASCH domain protein [Rhodobacteraceae bacterium THAF1]
MDEYRDLNDDYPGAGTFRFGDSAKLCRKLTDLVIAGTKTATCGALREFEDDPDSRPVVGRRDIACAWDGTPRVVIETTKVFECRFDAVPDAFARAEGEGTVADWRAGHIAFFKRNGGWSEDMMLLCERFRVVEVLE